jgi:hypothetical protein
MSFKPKTRRIGVGTGEAMTTGVIVMAPPFATTSSCLCYLWVLPIGTKDEDTITFDFLASTSDLSTTMAFALSMGFQ